MKRLVLMRAFHKATVAIIAVLITFCSWACSSDDSGVNESCKGTPTPCLLMGNACAEHQGCVSSACNGEATECIDVPTAPECWEQANCEWREGCHGDPVPCELQTGDIDCAFEPQCTWDNDTHTCSGEADCYVLDSSLCWQQDDCEWSNSCFGNTPPCIGLDSATCAQQLGCEVECTGTPVACSVILDAVSCRDHGGCDWY